MVTNDSSLEFFRILYGILYGLIIYSSGECITEDCNMIARQADKLDKED